MTQTEKQKIIHTLQNEIVLCKKRIENKEYSKESTTHFIRGIERAVYLVHKIEIK